MGTRGLTLTGREGGECGRAQPQYNKCHQIKIEDDDFYQVQLVT